MPIYMIQFSYTHDAWTALMKNPSDRSVPVRKLVEQLGGQFYGLYYCFGEFDGVVLFEAPDEVSAAAVSLAAGSPGHLSKIQTTVLLTVEETLESLRKAGGVSYAAPKS